MLIQGYGTQGLVSGVVGAIRDAAAATGTSFQYLLATARVESGLNPQAAATSSSARGLFQFIEQTWLTTLKHAGSALGYGAYADAITATSSGRYEVADPAMRQKVMALRDDPAANAAMAGAFTRHNAEILSQRIGRAPTDGELYIAHFLGSSGAGRLISLAADSPGTPAASAFPGAARANRPIFYDRDGSARTVGQVYGLLVGRYQTAAARQTPGVNAGVSAQAGVASTGVPSRLLGSASTAALAAGASPASSVASVGVLQAPASGYRSLFSDRGGAPVSQVVRELWSSRPTVAAALTGVPVASASAGPLDLYSDRPANARALFGAGQGGSAR